MCKWNLLFVKAWWGNILINETSHGPEEISDFSIRNCVWGFKCEKTWDTLSETDDFEIRFCGKCQKEVFLCNDDDSLVFSIARNRCIAINPESFVGTFPHDGVTTMGDIQYSLKKSWHFFSILKIKPSSLYSVSNLHLRKIT